MPDWGNLAEPLGTIIGFVLTLMVFSYIFGDNFLFRAGYPYFYRGSSRLCRGAGDIQYHFPGAGKAW